MFEAVLKVVFRPIKGSLIQGENAGSNQTRP
jgi:hypothetical protein